MDKKQNFSQISVGITILLILAFMVMAFLQFQESEESSVLPEQIEQYYNEDWRMVSLDDEKAAGIKSKNQNAIQKKLDTAAADGNFLEITLPYTEKDKAFDIVAFHNTLPTDFAGLTMNFASKNARVFVIFDGELIYQYGFSGEDISAKNEHFLDLPNVFENGEIWIELLPAKPGVSPTLGDVKLETRDTVVLGVFGNSIADIGCCLLIIMMAIIMLVLALIRKYTNQPSKGELFLGIAGIAAGSYHFIDTNTLSIFYNMQAPYVMQEYLLLIIPLLLALYFERNLHTVFPRRFNLLLWCVCANGILQILLQLLRIRSLEKMEIITIVVTGFICVTAIISLLQLDYKSRHYRTLLSVLSLLVLLVGSIITVIINTIYNYGINNKVGQYSMTLFAIMITTVHIIQLSKEYRANAEAARQEALAANEAKGKFLAHMSHEIRTPINAVLGMDEMILRESKEKSIKEYAMDIYTAGQTLLSLINDILDFSKIESGKMEIVPVEYDLSSLIHDLANMTSQRAENKNLKFEVEVEPEIPFRLYGDDVRIRQILTNILTNAVKYTQEGTIWLRVQGQQDGNTALLQFEVEDTGIGIKEEDLPKLSAEFERIEEERNRNIEGTGLGMSITIQLLTLLGSKLHVESVYGKGSKFYFGLEQKIIDSTPIGDFESRARQTAESYNYTTKFCAPEAKILVVDDNAVNRKVLRNLLKETLIQITDAASGKECLQLVQENYYDLIFLDHMMPEMDGLETLHQIKKLSDFPCQDTPIVVLTANAVTGAKEKYLAMGFDDFLSKPIVPEKLETMIQKILPQELLSEVVIDSQAAAAQTNPDIPGDFLEELPAVDGLDWHYAWLHLPDKELLAYTVKEFYAQIDPAAEHLGQAYERITEPEQLTQYRIQVHAMKSLAATVGIFPLSGVAKILEYAARDGKIDTIMSITKPFLEEWRSYREKLQGVFGIETEAKKKVTDHSIIKALVEMVRISMQEMDIDQADQVIGQLRAYEYSEEMEQNIQKLAEAVTNLDAEAADRLADILMNQMEA